MCQFCLVVHIRTLLFGTHMLKMVIKFDFTFVDQSNDFFLLNCNDNTFSYTRECQTTVDRSPLCVPVGMRLACCEYYCGIDLSEKMNMSFFYWPA